MNPSDINDFWFSDRLRKMWFASTPELDAEITQKFEHTWQQAASGELDSWRTSAEGCLALTIILDQFPLNMYRNEARSFQTEQQAVDITLHAIEQSFADQIEQDKLAFLLLPLMHSENLSHQDLSVKLFEQYSLENNLRFARHHRELIKKYGRFPHRNKILGRSSTDAEIEYLNSDQAFTG